MHFRTNNNYSYKAYSKKCILIHENLNKCLIPYDIYEDFKIFQRSFCQMFPDETKISVRYILYRLVLFYEHPCLELTFLVDLKTTMFSQVKCDFMFSENLLIYTRWSQITV